MYPSHRRGARLRGNGEGSGQGCHSVEDTFSRSSDIGRLTVHEVMIMVFCQVDSDGKLTELESRQAASEAVKNALKLVESNGFSHKHADVCSIGIADVENAKA